MFGIKNNAAYAAIRGSDKYPAIFGMVIFKQTSEGVLVTAKIHGLPVRTHTENPFFAFHLHEGAHCSGNEAEPFSNVGKHYNPYSVEHPCHSGDMPPLLSADGYAYQSFLTNRFQVGEVIGRTVIIHIKSDDFTTQPSGNAGEMIACGEIKKQ